MRILISNDDGIQAEGIQALCRAAATLPNAEVYVVAPDRQKSASSHGISLFRGLFVEEVHFEGAHQAFQVTGTPADCVKWAFAMLHRKQPFDVMLSGINAGANLAADVLYSGTVAAAGEAGLQGVNAYAFSHVGPPFDFVHAEKVVETLLPKLLSIEVPSDTFLNVNIPHEADASSVRWTKLGVRKYHDEFVTKLDENGREVYRYSGEFVDETGDGSTDVEAIRNKFVSITPLRYRFTNDEFFAQMNP